MIYALSIILAIAVIIIASFLIRWREKQQHDFEKLFDLFVYDKEVAANDFERVSGRILADDSLSHLIIRVDKALGYISTKHAVNKPIRKEKLKSVKYKKSITNH